MPAVIDKEKCDGCATCVESCPSEAISMVEEKAEVDKEKCIDCNACVDACTHQAITME